MSDHSRNRTELQTGWWCPVQNNLAWACNTTTIQPHRSAWEWRIALDKAISNINSHISPHYHVPHSSLIPTALNVILAVTLTCYITIPHTLVTLTCHAYILSVITCHTHIPQCDLYSHTCHTYIPQCDHASHLHPSMYYLSHPYPSMWSPVTPTSLSVITCHTYTLNVIFTATHTCHICVPQYCLYSHTHLSLLHPSTLSLQSHSPVTSASLNIFFTVTLSCARVTAGFIVQAASHDTVARSEIDRKKFAEAHASKVTFQRFSHSATPVKGFKSRFISPQKQ